MIETQKRKSYLNQVSLNKSIELRTYNEFPKASLLFQIQGQLEYTLALFRTGAKIEKLKTKKKKQILFDHKY